MSPNGLLPLTLVSLTAIAACGGSVETSPGSGGSGGGTTTAATTVGTTTATTTSTSGGAGPGSGGASSVTASSSDSGSTSTGSTPCTTHEECGNALCLFGAGECARPCDGGALCEACDEGTICDACGTSSCPDCDDCRAVCVEARPGQCDADTPCGEGEVCMFDWGQCFPPCTIEGCDDPGLTCTVCATGSCCGCRDCVDVCLPLEG